MKLKTSAISGGGASREGKTIPDLAKVPYDLAHHLACVSGLSLMLLGIQWDICSHTVLVVLLGRKLPAIKLYLT